jgi:hypothetical protein
VRHYRLTCRHNRLLILINKMNINGVFNRFFRFKDASLIFFGVVGGLVQHCFVHGSLRFCEVHWRASWAAANLRHVEHVKVISWINDEDCASYTLPAEIEGAFIVSARNRLEMEAQPPSRRAVRKRKHYDRHPRR